MSLPAETALLLLGAPELRAGKQTVLDHGKPRMLCLLAYVAVEGAVAKADVAALFWPAIPLPSARANLRQLLHRLRGVLGDSGALMEMPGDELDLSAGCVIDVRRFLASEAMPDGAAREAQLALYRGEFLQGLSLEGFSADLAGWIDAVRQRCRRRAASLAIELASQLVRQEQHEAALRHALQGLGFDPANQEALHLAMLLYSRSGATQRALALYHDWERRLVNDVAALPAPETHALYQQIRKTAWDNEAPHGDPHSKEFERRMLSVLALSWPMPDDEDEAEAAAEALDSLHARCSAVMSRFGAHLSSLPQGGLLAWFGYPTSQAHSAATAVRAVAALRQQVPEAAGMALALHAGSTLCNARTPDVSGILARAVLGLGSAADKGSLTASAACFEALDRPRWLAVLPATAAGMAAAPQCYRMQWHDWPDAGSPGMPRLPQAPGLLAGRTAELACLQQRWQAVQRGEFSLVQIGGAAGMGKSHLLRAFLADAGPAWIFQAHCDPFAADTPLHAIWLMFGAAAQAPGGGPVRQAMTRHVPLPAAARRGAQAEWGTSRPVTLEALEQVVAGLVAAVIELAALRPLVLVIEDVHWADPSTLAFLARLGRNPGTAPALVLASTRSAQPLWSGVPVSRIELEALDEHAGQALVRALNPALDAARMVRMLAVGGGHPLFLSELARRPDERQLPSSIGELVQGRLDQLGSLRKLAQMAALLGLAFKRPWLQAIAQAHGFDADAPEALLQAGLLREEPPLQLAFSHALLRDAIAGSLPERQFRELSRALGETLTGQFADDIDHTPEQAARWFTDAQEWQAALSWRLKACRLALSYVAYPETVREMEAGLALLPHLPSQADRDDWERSFRQACHQAVTPVRGVHSEASVEHYRRLVLLSGTDSGLPLDHDAMRAQMYAAEAQHGQRALLRLLRRLLRMPQVQTGDGVALLRLQESRVHALMLGGRIRQAAALHATLLTRSGAALPGAHDALPHDPRLCLAARGVILRMLAGEWKDDAAAERDCLEAARSSRQPLTLAYVLTFFTMAYLAARLPRRLEPLIDELLEVSGKLGLAVFRLYAQLAQASCRILSGDHSPCLEMSALLADMRAYAAFCCPGFLLYQAESWQLQGRPDLALAALQQGEADMARYGMFIYRTEYLILRARLAADGPAAQALLNKAYGIGMRQGAAAFALRAMPPRHA